MRSSHSLLQERIADVSKWIDMLSFQVWSGINYRSSSLFPDCEYNVIFDPFTYDKRAVMYAVQFVIQARLSALQKERSLPPKINGRLLLHRLRETTYTNTANEKSNGFFDSLDIPAWDCWIGFVPANDSSLSLPTDSLLCWVPSPLVNIVNNAVRASAEENISWMD